MVRVAASIIALTVFAQTSSAAPPELSGKWSGYWVSESSGHTGPLHGRFTPIDSQTYRVRFHGRFAGIIPFWYSTKLHVEGASEDVLVLAASRNLGPFGTFRTQATATATNFDASFTSKGDSGRFVLTRRR